MSFIVTLIVLAAVILVAYFAARSALNAIRWRFNKLDLQLQALENRLNLNTDSVVNAIYLNGGRFKFPVPLGGPSIDPNHARLLHFILQFKKPATILELGSGSSTAIIAKALEDLRIPTAAHIAVDHDARFLQLTKELCEANGFVGKIEYHHCPLVKAGDRTAEWYSIGQEIRSKGPFDLILVDGPPAYTAELETSRGPALPELFEHLAVDGVLLLDDANRPGERQVQASWRAQFPDLVFHHDETGKGVLVVSRRPLVE